MKKTASEKIMKKSRYHYTWGGSGGAVASQRGCLARTSLPQQPSLARAVRSTLQE